MRAAMLAVAGLCLCSTPASADDPFFLRLMGEVDTNDLTVGPLVASLPGEVVEFDIALDLPAGQSAPWGDVTMFYPLVIEQTRLSVDAGGVTQSFAPAASEQGQQFIVTSGAAPGASDADILDLPRLVVSQGVYSIRLLALDADAAALLSSRLDDLGDRNGADVFADGIDDVLIWRLDGISDDPRVRPGSMTIRLVEFQTPIVCVSDIADSAGALGADGVVDFGDFLAALALLGDCPGGPPPTPGCTADVADGFGNPSPDGVVDFGDFLFMLTQVNELCL